MVASVPCKKVFGIADVGVRRGLRGKLILQVRRHYYFCQFTLAGYEPQGEAHKTEWRDVDGNDPHAVQEVMNFLSKLSTSPLPFTSATHDTEVGD